MNDNVIDLHTNDFHGLRRFGGTLESIYGPRPHWKIVCSNTKTRETLTVPRYSSPTKEAMQKTMETSSLYKRFDHFEIIPADER
jgi:hypothetical protein